METVRNLEEAGKYIFFATRNGLVKKTELKDFSHVRANGIYAISIEQGDELVSASLTDGQQIIFNTPNGPVVDLMHFNSIEVEAATGDIVVSGRHLDAVMKIRRNPGQADDGKVLWKLGGTTPTDPATKMLTILNDPDGGPARQHDARILANGHLTIYDDMLVNSALVVAQIRFEKTNRPVALPTSRTRRATTWPR